MKGIPIVYQWYFFVIIIQIILFSVNNFNLIKLYFANNIGWKQESSQNSFIPMYLLINNIIMKNDPRINHFFLILFKVYFENWLDYFITGFLK